jgi:ABC-type branched-subunit amino acid transport system ATPase component/ABC-type branched-subunit amino acid transport system permease subunit
MRTFQEIVRRPGGSAITILTLFCIAAVPLISANSYHLHLLQLAAIYFIASAGLNFVTGYAGQASLGHAALFGVGAYTSALITMKIGFPFLFGLIAGAILAGALGFLLGIPSLRLSGAYLAMVTIAFNVIFERIVIDWSTLTEGPVGISGIPRPAFGSVTFGVETAFLLIVAFALLVSISMGNIVRSRYGRALMAIRESELAARCMGVNVYWYKLTSFVISALLAGMAGSLYAHVTSYISPEVSSINTSILLLLMIILGGMGTLEGPLIGALFLTIVPELMHGLDRIRLIAYGVLLVLAVIGMPKGIAGVFGSLSKRLLPFEKPQPLDFCEGRNFIKIPAARLRKGENLLEVRKVNKNFGGLAACFEVDMALNAGTIHALIGPNGSGKTTMINMISGVYRPTSGTISFGGIDLTNKPAYQIAKYGIGRTFQNIQLFSDLTVLDNIVIGQHSWRKNNAVSSILMLPSWKREEKESLKFALEIAHALGLSSKVRELAKNLSHGEQRRTEIARALAMKPKLLLLDEPAAGLGSQEIAGLDRLILDLKKVGITILLVEHHMELVMAISDWVTVLDYGCVIAGGKPAEIQNNKRVIEAYLGEEITKVA